MNPQSIQQIISTIVGAIQSRSGNVDWTKVTGNSNPQNDPTMWGNLQRGINAIFGPTLGSLINTYIVGQQYNRSGNLNSTLSGLLVPQSGRTYSNAFLSSFRDSERVRLYQDSKAQKQKLQQRFYEQYTNIFHAGKSQKQKRAIVQQYKKSLVSAPDLVKTFLDPTQIAKTHAQIRKVGAGVLNQKSKQNPFNINSYRVAEQFMQQAGQLALDANRVLFKGNSKYDTKQSKVNYGGFKSAAVAQLAGLLSMTADTIGDSQQEIKKSVRKFKDKVQKTSQALLPLRDIFGQDMKAMVSAVESMSGQNINQLQTRQIKSIATNISNILQYTGNVSGQQMLANGAAIANSLQLAGKKGFVKLAANSIGAYSTAMTIPQVSTYGVSRADYVRSTIGSLASAQGSSGVNYLALSFALWQNKRENKGKGIDEFQQLLANKTKNGENVLGSAMQIAGVSSRSQLVRGYNYSGYGQALSSGKLAKFGVQGQWEGMLRNVNSVLRQRRSQLGDKSIQNTMALLGNTKFLQTLSKGGVEALDTQYGGIKVGQKQKQALNFIINVSNGDLLKKANQKVQINKIRTFQTNMSNVRKAFSDIDTKGAVGWQQLMQQMQGDWKQSPQNNTAQGRNRAMARKSMYNLIGSQIFNTSDVKDTQKMHKNLYRNISDRLNIQGLSGDEINKKIRSTAGQLYRHAFFGRGKSDARYLQSLRILGKGQTSQEEKQQYINNVFNNLSQTQRKSLNNDIQTLKTKSSSSKQYKTALQRVKTVVSKKNNAKVNQNIKKLEKVTSSQDIKEAARYTVLFSKLDGDKSLMKLAETDFSGVASEDDRKKLYFVRQQALRQYEAKATPEQSKKYTKQQLQNVRKAKLKTRFRQLSRAQKMQQILSKIGEKIDTQQQRKLAKGFSLDQLKKISALAMQEAKTGKLQDKKFQNGWIKDLFGAAKVSSSQYYNFMQSLQPEGKTDSTNKLALVIQQLLNFLRLQQQGKK